MKKSFLIISIVIIVSCLMALVAIGQEEQNTDELINGACSEIKIENASAMVQQGTCAEYRWDDRLFCDIIGTNCIVVWPCDPILA